MEQYRGRKLLVVNVASRCGLTPQYRELQELYLQFGGPQFEIIAFPSNNFLFQEPGSNSEIKTYCSNDFNVTFKLMSRINVRGWRTHPVYRWLTKKSENGVADAKVRWNFQKYLIDEEGRWVKSLSPKTSPLDPRIVQWINSKKSINSTYET